MAVMSCLNQNQCFATVYGLNDMFTGNGVQRGLRYVFSCLVGGVKNVSNVYINHAVLKTQLTQWVQVKLFNMCLLQLGIRNN